MGDCGALGCIVKSLRICISSGVSSADLEIAYPRNPSHVDVDGFDDIDLIGCLNLNLILLFKES
jgi:hypothetical protein